jgi:hypothetical protein
LPRRDDEGVDSRTDVGGLGAQCLLEFVIPGLDGRADAIPARPPVPHQLREGQPRRQFLVDGLKLFADHTLQCDSLATPIRCCPPGSFEWLRSTKRVN